MPDIFAPKKTPQEPPKTIKTAHLAATQSVHALMNGKTHGIGPFAAYSERPRGFTFVNQEPDEVILLFLRRHFITNIPWIFYTLIAILIPPVLAMLAQLPGTFIFSLPTNFISIVIAFYYLIVAGYAFSQFVSWFYNIGIITQKRIVDLDSSNILSHNTAAANFNEIVDVTFTQNGFFQSFFDYGDVVIQTEAIHANFEFTAAPKPTRVSDLISDLRVASGGKE